jgi:hypothetical protein
MTALALRHAATDRVVVHAYQEYVLDYLPRRYYVDSTPDHRVETTHL